MIYLCRFSQLKAQGTSLAILLPPAGILAFIDYYKRDQVNLQAGILICMFLIIGSVFGAKISHIISINILRKLFGILMILISIKLILENNRIDLLRNISIYTISLHELLLP
ncbi:sulfite exporter TauE/SafE family protein [Clostridium kluyveri]|uniref:Probable membrane transporter protein n=1 Tax=Clostridium kluyveri (strain ATCC 8527 / DSM 555 / NBRC 12016 / NCIMB 10680 / K1) TaxID=431943 RepID=A5N3E6_CLOK5|nr:Conserved hypothetical protein [Clostridium kluyveri DSM 555]